MMRVIVALALLATGCGGAENITGPSPTPGNAPPVAGPAPAPPPQFAARPVCTSSRLPQPTTETRSYAIVGPAQDGTRSNPFEMSYGPTRAYGVWYVDVEWQKADAPLNLRVLKQDATIRTNPAVPVSSTTARTGMTSWSACWEGTEDDRMSVEISFPAGTSQDVRVTWTYPSPRTAARPTRSR